LRSILLETWKSHGSPLRGYILANKDRSRVNLDNLSKRSITPTLALDETLPKWTGWYSIRRFHGTQVRHKSKSGETAAKALGNTKDVLDKHYLKSTEVLPEVRKAKTGYFRANLNLRLFNRCSITRSGEPRNFLERMAGTTRLELATSAVTVSGLQVLSTT
jgi:hypothetical protein